jgi:3-oxoadipate enol-lactonase/3-oxoadipate enol-lactonase/4-carboxymuconolactone decarboxylase
VKKTRHASVGGRDIAYLTSGPEGALPIVFIHGLAASKEAWSGLIARLEPRFRTVSYDLRGHGESAPHAARCSRAELAAELVGLLDAATVERAVLVGHSAGGVIAMQTAVDAPDRVAALVLIGTASLCNERTATWYTSTAQTARREGGASGMRAMGVRGSDVPVPDGPTFAEVADAMATLHADPLTERLREVTVPTLIVVGEKDFLGAGGSVILSRTVEGSELEILPQRGHGVHLEDPEWLAARITRFLDVHLTAAPLS